MRKHSLLEFYNIHITTSYAHDIEEVIQQLLRLEIEHSYHKIRPVLWLLVGKGECVISGH